MCVFDINAFWVLRITSGVVKCRGDAGGVTVLHLK